MSVDNLNVLSAMGFRVCLGQFECTISPGAYKVSGDNLTNGEQAM